MCDLPRRPVSARVLLAAGLLLAASGHAQPPAATPAAPPPAAPQPRFSDPWAAYQAGAFDQALQGFVDQQVERPDDPALWLNLGNVHYRIKDYAAAENAFQQAALAGSPELREQALYNLGNCAFRQGRLEEAVERYKQALELDPNDEDAKFNLEFVRDEIRRRHEEAQKRQQQQQQQQQQQGENQQEQEQQQGENPQDSQQDQQGGDPGGQQDRDQDGLPDSTETAGDNPTDPNNPDSDGDGLSDGQEDANRNGRRDPGETDPNQADSDGNGVGDGEQAAQQEAQQEAQQAAAGEPQQGEAGMTPEEAERYLQALSEGRPKPQQPKAGRRARPDKDW